MKNSVGKGATVLIISGFICKIFGALFRLPLTNILSIQGIGVFQMVMSIYSLMLGFVSAGVSNSLSKLISSARAKGETVKLGGYYKLALVFSLGLSLSLGLLFAIFSKSIASFQGVSSATFSYMLMVVLLPLGALIGVFRGIIQGFENMTPTAISQIIEQMTKFVTGLTFAYLLSKRGLAFGVLGAFLGILVSEIFALIFLGIVMAGRIKLKPNNSQVKQEFFKAVLPLTFSGAVIPFSSALESMLIVVLLSYAGLSNEVATTLYGLQSGVVGAILHFPLIISLSVAMALLPKISFLSAQGDYEGQKNVISKAFNIMWFLLIPLIVGIIAISKAIYPIIYPAVVGGYLDIAYQLTILGGFAIVLSAFMQLLNSTLQAKGYYNYSLLFNILGAFFKIGTLIIFARNRYINIYAIPISNMVLYSIICICALVKLGYLVRIKFYSIALPLISSFVMFMVVKIWLSFLSNIWGVLSAVAIGIITYFLLCLPLVRQYSEELFKKMKDRRVDKQVS